MMHFLFDGYRLFIIDNISFYLKMEKIIICLFYADRLLALLPELVAKCSGTTPFGAPF
jgi:hypothetical protein